MESKIDFIICGTQKGGTTALYSYLKEHPQIYMPDIKEVHFFDNEAEFSTGRPDYSIYHSFFNPAPVQTVVGEATPIYMYWRSTPRRISEYNPNTKLIVILRNPIERAFSHWNMERSRGNEEMFFTDALNAELDRCANVYPQQHRIFSYIDRGFYVGQLQRIWSYFPKNQVLILRNEDLKQQPLQTLNKVFEFLDVDELQEDNLEIRNVHSHNYLTSMSDEELDYLKSIFEKEIVALESLLGWDCSNWLRV